MKHIVREVFSLPAMDVVKASYKDTTYYIAGSSDITEYVSTIKSSFSVTELDAIKYGLAEFLRLNPVTNILPVKQFQLVILDNPKTSKEYVIDLVADLFRKPHEEAVAIAERVHYDGSAVVGQYTFEIAHTFACMVETSNEQTNNVLETDIIDVQDTASMDSMEVLEALIRRDYPNDI